METPKEVHIKPHRIISQIISVLTFFGMWETDNQFFITKSLTKLIYFLISSLFCVSLFSGSYLSADYNESFFLTAAGIGGILQFVKLIYVLAKQDQITTFLNDICVHSIPDRDEFNAVQGKLNNFARFGYVNVFITTIGIIGFHIVTLPIFSTEVALPLSIGLPFDWRNNRINYWLAHSYIAIGILIAAVAYFFTMVYWYIMYNCSIKYKILGNRFRTLGYKTTAIISMREKEELLYKYLVELVRAHQDIQR